MWFINKATHYLVGMLVGWCIRRCPRAAAFFAIAFCIYQVIERQVKHQRNPLTKDGAYPELREFQSGMGLGFAAEITDAIALDGGGSRWAAAWYRDRVRALCAAVRAKKSTGD